MTLTWTRRPCAFVYRGAFEETFASTRTLARGETRVSTRAPRIPCPATPTNPARASRSNSVVHVVRAEAHRPDHLLTIERESGTPRVARRNATHGGRADDLPSIIPQRASRRDRLARGGAALARRGPPRIRATSLDAHVRDGCRRETYYRRPLVSTSGDARARARDTKPPGGVGSCKAGSASDACCRPIPDASSLPSRVAREPLKRMKNRKKNE